MSTSGSGGQKFDFLVRTSVILIAALGCSLVYAQQSDPLDPTKTREAQEAFNCLDVSQWSESERDVFARRGTYRGHDLQRCGQEWALKNKNEAMAIATIYMQGVESRVKKARDSGDSASLQKFRSENLCDAQTLDGCYDEVQRRNLSHTVHMRERILSNNRLMFQMGAVGNGPPIAAKGVAPPAPSFGPPARAKTYIEVIEELRKSKHATGCEQNPFIPCKVAFGQRPVQGDPLPEDQALAAMAKGRYEISEVGTGVRKRAGKADETLEIDTNRDDATMKKRIEGKLNDTDPANPYRRQAYIQDIEVEKKRLEAQAKDPNYVPQIRGYEQGSPSWEAFQEAMNLVMAERQRAATSPDEIVSLYLGVRTQSAQGKSANYITTDGTIERHVSGGISAPPPPAAGPSSGATSGSAAGGRAPGQ